MRVLTQTQPAPSRPATLVDSIVDQAGGCGAVGLLDASGVVRESVSWRDIHDRARRMSAVLARCGLGPGGRVALIGETSLDLVAALQAVWLRGAAVTILPPAGPDDRHGSRNQVRAALADAAVDLIIEDVGSGQYGQPLLGLRELAERATGATPLAPYRPAPGDLALLQYTSGSTRSPRGVPVTHGHLAANVRAIAVAIDHDRSHPSRMLSWLPLYHDMGVIGFLCLPMMCGCDLLLQSPAAFARNPAGWLHAMSRHRVTMSGAPNFAYGLMARLLAAPTRPDLDLTSVRCLISGGEPVAPETMARLAEAGRPFGLDPASFTPAYGLAETTLAACISPVGGGIRVDRVDPEVLESLGRAVAAAPDGPARALVRVGPPVPGTEVRVVDGSTGMPVDDRTVGEIELRGPSVVGHYWPDPAPPPRHWLRTGDLGYLADGELVVCGRAKDVLFAAGRNVYPQDVEAVAAEVPGVRAGGSAAFGTEVEADPVGGAGTAGDRLVVVIETRSTDPASVRQAVAAAVRAEVGLAPADVVAVPYGRLPRTTSGKLRRAETRRRYLSGDLHPSTHRKDPS